jgi:hypothetical protein
MSNPNVNGTKAKEKEDTEIIITGIILRMSKKDRFSIFHVRPEKIEKCRTNTSKIDARAKTYAASCPMI